jgi:hypothetical protein
MDKLPDWQKRDTFSTPAHQRIVEGVNLSLAMTGAGDIDVANSTDGRTVIDRRARAASGPRPVKIYSNRSAGGEYEVDVGRWNPHPVSTSTTYDSGGSSDFSASFKGTLANLYEDGFNTHQLPANKIIVAWPTGQQDDQGRPMFVGIPNFPPPPGTLFYVTVAQAGGSAGNKTTECSFTYAVTHGAFAFLLGSAVGLTGHGNRVLNAAMTAGTNGWACYLTDGTLQLLWVDERLQQTNCT